VIIVATMGALNRLTRVCLTKNDHLVSSPCHPSCKTADAGNHECPLIGNIPSGNFYEEFSALKPIAGLWDGKCEPPWGSGKN
jgi:hypothetical protein